MYNEFQKQTLDLGKQLAEQAYTAQIAALKGYAEIQTLQLKALETQAKANLAWIAESLGARESKDLTAQWPKGLDFARDSAEAAYATSQEILGVAKKTAEEVGALTRTSLNAATTAASAASRKAA